jgi:hypothetical protein
VVKGWLRLSLRTVDSSDPWHRPYLPTRNYFSTDVQPVALDTPYPTDIELWPTNVVVARGNRLVLQVASCDTQGSGLFNHTHEEDRAAAKLRGWNCIHVGGEYENFLRLPIIPAKGD